MCKGVNVAIIDRPAGFTIQAIATSSIAPSIICYTPFD